MAICGLALGLAALGNLLMPLTHGSTIRYICGVLSLICLIIYACKLIFDWPHAKEELKTPVPLSVMPTVTMAIMLLSTYIRPHGPNIAVAIWMIAVFVHMGIMLWFCYTFIPKFSFTTVFPSWFIQGVGLVTVSVTAPAMNALLVGQIAWWIGFVLYFVVLVLVVIRMNTVRVFPEPARKTLAIFAAPMGLLTVGYFSSFVSQGAGIVPLTYFLIAGALVSYLYVCIKLFEIMKIRFYPTYSSFTFPFVISALAFRLGANFIANRYGWDWLRSFANITMWIAVAMVVYVIIQYVRYYKFWMKY